MGFTILLIQFFQITILTFATFSLVLVFLLLFKPKIFDLIAKTSNITISSNPLLQQLEAKRDTDKKTLPHLRKLSVLIIIVAALSLHILFSYKQFFLTSNFVTSGKGMEWLVAILIQSTAWFFFIFLSLSIAFGFLMIFIPDKFPAISDFFNQWISTEKLYSSLSIFKNFDTFFMQYRYPIGVISFLILTYVIYSCFIRYL